MNIHAWLCTTFVALALGPAAYAAPGSPEPTEAERHKLDRARLAMDVPHRQEVDAAREEAIQDAPVIAGTAALSQGDGRPIAEADAWPAGLGPRPESRPLSRGLLDQVRTADASVVESLGFEEDWGHVENERARLEALAGQDLEFGPSGGGPTAGGGLDDDTVHYARGSTLVLHVFVNHANGTWSESEMDQAGARAALAKEFWLDRAPRSPQGASLSNLHFDYEGLDGYWSVTATLSTAIPESGMGSDAMEAALAALGLSDLDGDSWIVDDYTIALQDALGGWDNVMLLFQPADVDGRAWASYSFARTALYPNSGYEVYAHEWGHLFGACDEYIEDGTCNDGLDCGTCQGWYVETPRPNLNCDLSCGNPGNLCMMKGNDFTLCPFTIDHVSWNDADQNGVLDYTLRRIFGSIYVPSIELVDKVSVLASETVANWVAPVRDASWSVVGARNPSGSIYEIELYGENNLNHLYATSGVGHPVEFVVADYNHMPPGNDYILLDSVIGSGNYRLQFEAGTEEVYADGVERVSSWSASDVVRVFELPLFAGEAIAFVLDPSSQLDLGMALFRSDGTAYRGSRSTAAWTRDAAGDGGAEIINYLVPADDVYGLVLWSNGPNTGTATLEIGPSTFPLAEESTYETNSSLALCRYTPNASSWSFLGVRPTLSGTDASLRLFDDASFTTELEQSSGSGGLEFIVADYNHLGWETEYARSSIIGGGNQQIQWEHDNDLLGGRAIGSWGADDLGKIWDVFLKAGNTYFFRTYEAGGPRGLHLFYSGAGDLFHAKGDAIASSTSRPPSQNGEWFSMFCYIDDWFGLAMTSEFASSSGYELWYGPQTIWSDDDPQVFTNEVAWGTHVTFDTDKWAAAASRSSQGDASIALFGDEGYNLTLLEASDGGGVPVSFVVMDYNHETLDSQYLRSRNAAGGFLTVEFEAGQQQISFFEGGSLTRTGTFGLDEIIDMYDLSLPGSRTEPQDVVIEVVPTSGNLDLGVALFRSDGAPYKASRTEAVSISDVGGEGLEETITYTSQEADVYGLAVWSRTSTGGSYEIHVYDPSVTAVGEGEPGADDAGDGPQADQILEGPTLRMLSPNPSNEQVRWELALASEASVVLEVFDASGRLVRSTPPRTLGPGRTEFEWDGRETTGRPVGTGVYFARFRIGESEHLSKVVRR
ncbi:MAG: FlgD immunoglobulin-like domain containing protein [Candidatus Eisenbacteria bacterium]